MSDNYNGNEDFDSLFNSTGDSGSSTLTREEVERIATNTFVRGYQALQQGVSEVQRLKEHAMRQTEAHNPGFLKRINDPEICRRFIEEKPATARAILAGESGQGTAFLSELYETFDESARKYETPQPSNEESGPTPASGSASVLSLAQINALPPELRRAPIETIKNRIGDLSIDLADPNAETFRIERGEK